MRRVFAGAGLVTVGIATLIEAHTAQLSRTDHDLLLVGVWALVTFGAAIILLGLIGYAAAQTQRLIRFWGVQSQEMEEELEARERMEEFRRTRAKQERDKRKRELPLHRSERRIVGGTQSRAPFQPAGKKA